VTEARSILIVGLPRSGTTWTMRALGSAEGTTTILEPDNEDKYPASIHAKRKVGRYPVLRAGDQAPGYHKLWDWILEGAHEDRRSRLARHLLGPGAVGRIHEGRSDPVTWLAATLARDPRSLRTAGDLAGGPRIVTKSIHAQLAVEWLAAEFDVDVLLLLRHPANVLASWMELNLKDSRNSTLETRRDIRSRYLEPWGVPLPGADPIERMSWRIGLLIAAIEEASAQHPEWHVRTHDQLCANPTGEFQQLYAELGLAWGKPTEEFLEGHNAPGSGFAVKRIASELSDSWHSRLTDEQVATLRRVLHWFPITTWSDRDFDRPPAGTG
jgi:hypothetical protein